MGGEKPSLMLVLVKVCILTGSNTVFFIQGVRARGIQKYMLLF